MLCVAALVIALARLRPCGGGQTNNCNCADLSIGDDEIIVESKIEEKQRIYY